MPVLASQVFGYGGVRFQNSGVQGVDARGVAADRMDDIQGAVFGSSCRLFRLATDLKNSSECRPFKSTMALWTAKIQRLHRLHRDR